MRSTADTGARLCSALRPTQYAVNEYASPPVAAEFEARDAVWHALALLPRRQRAVLVLRFYEDMSEKQIADVLGIGVGTVRSSAWRGLERLRTEPRPPRALPLQ